MGTCHLHISALRTCPHVTYTTTAITQSILTLDNQVQEGTDHETAGPNTETKICPGHGEEQGRRYTARSTRFLKLIAAWMQSR